MITSSSCIIIIARRLHQAAIGAIVVAIGRGDHITRIT